MTTCSSGRYVMAPDEMDRMSDEEIERYLERMDEEEDI